MKNIILLSILLIASITIAQTPFSMMSLHHENNGPAKISASSLNNPWVGAKLAYNLAGDVSNSFLLSGRIMYVAAEGPRWAAPIMTNVGFNNIDSLDEDNGVSIGVYPWYTLSDKNNTTVLLHGGLNYHVLDKIESGYVTEVRLMAGAECAIYGDDGGAPFTLSAGPEYIINTGGGIPNMFAVNITGVVPIAEGLGLLIEGDIPLIDTQVSTGIKIGVIVNNAIK